MMAVRMTQPYAVSEEVLWLTRLDVRTDDKESHTAPQRHTAGKHSRLTRELAVEITASLAKIKR